MADPVADDSRFFPRQSHSNPVLLPLESSNQGLREERLFRAFSDGDADNERSTRDQQCRRGTDTTCIIGNRRAIGYSRCAVGNRVEFFVAHALPVKCWRADLLDARWEHHLLIIALVVVHARSRGCPL